MSTGRIPLELDAARMQELLDELDARLRARGIKATIYLVGGAAMALGYGREGLTPDIDAIISHQAVREEARVVAVRHGLPEHWLNSNAAGWVPPRPPWARKRPTKLGLTVHVAPAEHVLAMKLIASRRKDRPDIRLLIQHTGMAKATTEDYANLLRRVYADEDLLADMLGIPGSDWDATWQEALALGRWAQAFAKSLPPAQG